MCYIITQLNYVVLDKNFYYHNNSTSQYRYHSFLCVMESLDSRTSTVAISGILDITTQL